MPDWQRSARFPFDPDLSPAGHEQAVRTARRLAREPIVRLLSSPYLRTLHTSRCVSDALGIPIGIEPGLGEILNPEWFPAAPILNGSLRLEYEATRRDATYVPGPEPEYPETWSQHQLRCDDLAKYILEACRGDAVLITHGASVIGLTEALTGHREEAVVAPCSLTLLEGPPWRLVSYGDTAHLGDASRHG